MTQTWMLADCAVLSGPAWEVLRLSQQLSRLPRALLVHGQFGDDPRSVVLGRLNESSLLPSSIDAAAPAIALAAPLARVSGALLAPVVELTQSPLVSACRELLERLDRDPAQRDVPELASLEDALISLLRAILSEYPLSADPTSQRLPLAERVELLIELRHTDSRLDVARIARELHTSRRQLYRHSGDAGIAEMLSGRRVETAQELLATRAELTISEIAARSGFTSAAHLRAQLMRWTGETPTEYRRRHGSSSFE